MASTLPTTNSPRASGCRWSRVAHGAAVTPNVAPRIVKPAQGKRGNSEPVPKDKYDASHSGTCADQSMPWTIGVHVTSDTPATPQTRANARGVGVNRISN